MNTCTKRSRIVDAAEGQQAKSFINERGMCIDVVAEALAVPGCELQAYCDGRSRIPAVVLYDLSAFLNVRIDGFFASVPPDETLDHAGVKDRK
jgi:hypothetical protein